MQTLILTHGALGSMADLEKLAAALRKENYEVFSFSFSGHGKTNFETEFNIKQFSSELEQFILSHKLIQPPVLGYSMGGYVALQLASINPALLGKIICLATKFNWTKEAVEKEVALLDPELILKKIPAYANSLELKHGVKWKELVIKTAQLMQDIHDNNYLSEDKLKAIQNKILVGIGDKDQMVSFNETLNTYKNLTNAGMYVLPNTKHQLESININVLISIVNEFMKN